MAFCKYLIILLLFLSGLANGQVNQYFVFFKDKSGTPYSLSSPEQFLSTRSVQRRIKQNISLTTEDLPVNPDYINQVKNAGATLYYSSRWWNGVLVEADVSVIAALNSFPFVSKIELIAPGKKNIGGRVRATRQKKNTGADSPINQNQLTQIGIDEMHALGFRGEGMLMAIFDSGFIGVNTTAPFGHLFINNQIVQTFNFVNKSNDVYRNDDHGTEVFSVISAVSTGIYTGGVYNANFLLYLTEDITSEYRVEEYNWTIAAERADSAGVDVINSSLGYNVFDDPAMDYSKNDLDGKTAVISKAARKAIEKGIVVVCSAGNEGGNSWKLVTPPADVDGILAVGSVNSLGALSSFSSMGPTSDDRIKPDVVAMGSATSVIKFNGTTGTASGTSLASPLVASLVAGVWQAWPDLSANEVINSIIKSSSQAVNPDYYKGYGIPHFLAVKNYLENLESDPYISIYPNPVSGNYLHVKLKEVINKPLYISIFDSQGKLVEEHSRYVMWVDNPFQYDVSNLLSGMYLIRVIVGNYSTTLKFVKQ